MYLTCADVVRKAFEKCGKCDVDAGSGEEVAGMTWRKWRRSGREVEGAEEHVLHRPGFLRRMSSLF